MVNPDHATLITRTHRVRNWGLAAFVNLLWAAQYPAYKRASDGMNVSALNFWTFAVAIAVLAPFYLAERRRHAREAIPKPTISRWPRFFLLGALGIIPPSVLLAWGISHSTASDGAILSLTIPVLMVAMATTLLKERPTPFYLWSVALALAGTALLSWSSIANGNFGHATLWGNVVIFVAGAGAAFYNAYSKRVLEVASELELLLGGYVIALALCAILSSATDTKPFYDIVHVPSSAWWGVLVLGAGSWGLAMVIWMWLLRRLELTQLSVAVYLLPVFGLVLSVLTLGERPTWFELAGGLVVLGSAYVSSAQPASVRDRLLQSDTQ